MEHVVVTALRLRRCIAVAWIVLTPCLARAQETAVPPFDGEPASRTWIVVGGASTTLLGDCTGCAADTYLHSGSVVGNIGLSINRRTDVGAEVFWMPQTLGTGDRTRVTFLMGAIQFRPWQSRGFLLKGGIGMAFLRNWLDVAEDSAPPIRSKAFALNIGAGWEWRVRGRIGVQAFGTQHAAALGDLQTSQGTVENVMGNFWSVGGAVVLR